MGAPWLQIIGGEDENGQVKLSIRRLEFARAWERVRQIQVSGRWEWGRVKGEGGREGTRTRANRRDREKKDQRQNVTTTGRGQGRGSG